MEKRPQPTRTPSSGGGKGRSTNGIAPARSSLWKKSQSEAIDAIAQAGGRRPVGKHMAEMRAATAAMHLGACHPMRVIDRGGDGAVERIEKARPAGAAREFLARGEERLIASGAGEDAGTLLLLERAASRRLGAMTTHDDILVGREPRPPFFLGAGDGELLVIGFRCAHSSPPRQLGSAEQDLAQNAPATESGKIRRPQSALYAHSNSSRGMPFKGHNCYVFPDVRKKPSEARQPLAIAGRIEIDF